MVSVLPILLLLLPAAGFFPNADANGRHGHGYSLNPHAVCSRLRVSPPSNLTWLPLHHRRGPCSPSNSGGSRASPASILRRDQLRADDIRRKVSRNVSSADVTFPTSIGTSLGTLEYVVTVGLGTPALRQTVLIDTASDLSWVQCRPCPTRRCHRQKDVVFDPTKSSTYSSIRCGSPACARLGGRGNRTNNGCSSSPCQYAVTYGDGSSTTGTYSSDTLTTDTSSHSHVVVNSFRFGCSHADEGFSDRTDGILALGGGTPSLVSQTGGRAFSYCLPPTVRHAGFLTLGAPPRASTSRFAVTPMYRLTGSPTFHAVVLEAVAVAGRRLDVPAAAFTAGAIVDSGTIITRLPPTAYRALRAAFRAEMKAYRRARPKSILDTCYNLTGVRDVKVPGVALVFDRGASVELDSAGIMQYGCLAFAPTTGGDDGAVGIIGNVQQRTLEVLYDVGGGAFGFRRGAC